MALVMSLALTIVRTGPVDGWFPVAVCNAVTAFPIALCATLIIGPPIRRLVVELTRQAESPPSSKQSPD
ncbi:DUF2798 domain-containing protein [Paraburkholderia sp. LEh10]|uniref:DUF2798 domain-containing protein n=1 Tax=Paraburkholderia sp. LEh10 TaxID=2821353 RepID=UPI0039183482